MTTTSAGGAEAVGQTDWSPLAGRDVVILPDNDLPGQKYATDVKQALQKIGAKSITTLALPGLPEKGDLYDWFVRGETVERLTALVEEKRRTSEGEASEEWKEGLEWTTDRKGEARLKGTNENVMLVLRHDPRIAGFFGWDAFQKAVLWRKTPPFGTRKIGEMWIDADTVNLQAWFERHWGLSLRETMLIRAVDTVAQDFFSFHPLQEYFRSLRWDGVERLSTWLSTVYGSTQDPRYLAQIGKHWLISGVARIMGTSLEGVKADHFLVLEGKQGLRKSTSLAVLATFQGRTWMSDTPLFLGTKDAYLALEGCFLVEFAELEALNKTEAATLKAFFSSRRDRVRRPFARKPEELQRQCIFAGTVNDDEYLSDPTGGRRFWPVACEKVDLPALEAMKEQLWAEAVRLYEKGERWWPETTKENNLCKREQALRLIPDPWLSLVVGYLSLRQSDPITPDEIFEKVLEIPKGRRRRSEQSRLTGILQQIPGWKKAFFFQEGVRLYYYQRLSSPSASDSRATTDAAPDQTPLEAVSLEVPLSSQPPALPNEPTAVEEQAALVAPPPPALPNGPTAVEEQAALAAPQAPPPPTLPAPHDAPDSTPPPLSVQLRPLREEQASRKTPDLPKKTPEDYHSSVIQFPLFYDVTKTTSYKQAMAFFDP